MAISKKPRSAQLKKPPIPIVGKSGPPQVKARKTFKVEIWDVNEGERVIINGDTGIGKTSLGALAPDPVFIGLDEGGSKIRHPVTNEPLMRVPDVETFEDVRDALRQYELFDPYKSVVVDTITILQDWAEPYVIATIPTEKGAHVKNIMGYGYNKGYKHLYNTMKLILQDCDELIRRNKNVIFISQAALHNIPNPAGEDYLREGLRLHKDKSWDIESLYCEWADHILRVAYLNTFAKDKKITGDTERAVFVQPEVYFRAKSRTVQEPVISYETNADDSVWRFIFGGVDDQK